jgi:hypothetical protein
MAQLLTRVDPGASPDRRQVAAESTQSRGSGDCSVKLGLTAGEWAVAKLVWRVKLDAELEPGNVLETEVARIERDDYSVSETVGLTLDESKRLTAAPRAAILRAQIATMGERLRWCEHCGQKLLSKGYYTGEREC